VLARREVSKDAELLVLRHECRRLRRQADRVLCQPVDTVLLRRIYALIVYSSPTGFLAPICEGRWAAAPSVASAPESPVPDIYLY